MFIPLWVFLGFAICYFGIGVILCLVGKMSSPTPPSFMEYVVVLLIWPYLLVRS